ncbi:hypothetical protein F4774DRAFT_372385 [Daldinia eschscholtzii]|nr:hypothetical protein F4774DRAFT_372385 [Daldinia eschscholtzii]
MLMMMLLLLLLLLSLFIICSPLLLAVLDWGPMQLTSAISLSETFRRFSLALVRAPLIPERRNVLAVLDGFQAKLTCQS